MRKEIEGDLGVIKVTLSINADDAIKILNELTKSLDSLVEKVKGLESPTVNVDSQPVNIDSIIDRITSKLQTQIDLNCKKMLGRD